MNPNSTNRNLLIFYKYLLLLLLLFLLLYYPDIKLTVICYLYHRLLNIDEHLNRDKFNKISP